MRKISFIVCPKEHEVAHPDFHYHTAITLNYLSLQLERENANDSAEILVLDWTPSISLKETLPLKNAARKLCRFISIPQSISGKISRSSALNAAIRRSCGDYILCMDSNTIFPAYSLRAITRFLNSSIEWDFSPDTNLFFLNRRNIPWKKVKTYPSIEEWEHYIINIAGTFPIYQPGHGLGTAGTGFLAHRQIWETLRGFNESIHHALWMECELVLRATQKYPLIDLGGVGAHFFYMSYPVTDEPSDPNAASFDLCPTIDANTPEWGLSALNLLQETSQSPEIPIPHGPPAKKIPDTHTLSQEIQRNEVKEYLDEYFKNHLDILYVEVTAETKEEVDFELMFYLTWFSHEFSPSLLYYYGADKAHPIAIIAKSVPGISIYTVNDWKDSEKETWAPISRLGSMLRNVAHQGYVRHLTGNPSTAFSRLLQSATEPIQINLAIISNVISEEDTCREISQILPHLAPPFMLVIQDTPPRLRNTYAKLLEALTPYTLLLSNNNRNLILLKD